MPSPVLVVGAGPAGLVAALDLARRGEDVTLIERAQGPAAGSRGKGLQPRTLETLERLGVLEEVLDAGAAFPRWRSYRAGRLAWEKSIYELLGMGEPVADSAVPYPETWMLPQWRTEEILRRALSGVGVEVEYGSRLAGLDQSQDVVVAAIDGARGRQVLQASHVVAADGAASTVRGLLGISFEGVTREDERFIIADVRTADLDRRYWHNWSDPQAPAARVSVCPLPSSDRFQFVAPLLPDQDLPPLTVTTLQRLFDERSDGAEACFTDASWITVSRTNERLASRFRDGRVFLVGDAAHAVPAAGGQGLNTAVEDSHNLGWKLAAVRRGAPAGLLDSFEEERRPIAARLMAGLNRVDEDGAAPDVFQLRNNYRGGALSRESRRAPGAIRAGDRAPDAPLRSAAGAPSRLFELMRRSEFTCIAFGDSPAVTCAVASQEHAGRISLRLLDVGRDSPATVDAVRTTYGVPPDAEALFVVRPDGYIGLAADDLYATRLGEYLMSVAPG